MLPSVMATGRWWEGALRLRARWFSLRSGRLIDVVSGGASAPRAAVALSREYAVRCPYPLVAAGTASRLGQANIIACVSAPRPHGGTEAVFTLRLSTPAPSYSVQVSYGTRVGSANESNHVTLE